MNEPMQNKEEFSGGSKSSANAEIHDRTGLYIAIIALIIAAISLGMQIMQPAITDAKVESLRGEVKVFVDRATVSENHWRNIEVELKNLQSEVAKNAKR